MLADHDHVHVSRPSHELTVDLQKYGASRNTDSDVQEQRFCKRWPDNSRLQIPHLAIPSAAQSHTALRSNTNIGASCDLPLFRDKLAMCSRLVWRLDSSREVQFLGVNSALDHEKSLVIDRTGGGKTHTIHTSSEQCSVVSPWFCIHFLLSLVIKLKSLSRDSIARNHRIPQPWWYWSYKGYSTSHSWADCQTLTNTTLGKQKRGNRGLLRLRTPSWVFHPDF